MNKVTHEFLNMIDDYASHFDIENISMLHIYLYCGVLEIFIHGDDGEYLEVFMKYESNTIGIYLSGAGSRPQGYHMDKEIKKMVLYIVKNIEDISIPNYIESNKQRPIEVSKKERYFNKRFYNLNQIRNIEQDLSRGEVVSENGDIDCLYTIEYKDGRKLPLSSNNIVCLSNINRTYVQLLFNMRPNL